jgi:hypothetical protein
MRIAKETSGSVSHEFFGFFLVAICAVATGPELFFAKETFATTNGEGDHYTITLLKFGNRASNFHHFAHRFVTEDVAFFHRWHVMIVQMQVRPADSGGCDPYNDVARVFDDWIRNRVATHITFPVPN